MKLNNTAGVLAGDLYVCGVVITKDKLKEYCPSEGFNRMSYKPVKESIH